nr:hypothetical protein [Tanacetum cinerariifolium]
MLQLQGIWACSRECQKPKREKDAAYHREKMLLSHYMYMAKLQQVSPDAVDSGPIFDKEPKQKIDQNDEDADLAEERELLASLIAKLKCEIDESKKRNTFLETSNKVLVEKLKSELEDFKNKNKSLTEANNKVSKENDLLYADFKKSKAEMKRRDSIEYASEMELECAKVKAYHREKMLLCKQEEARIQLNAEQADWKDDTDDESNDHELEAHYMYMAKLQQVSPDAVDTGPIFDKEPEQKVQNDDQYDVFTIECQHPEQSGSAYKTYLIEQDAHNVIIESKDMNYDSEQIDQYDEDANLAEERQLLASLIEKLKCEIDESKNCNTLLETSNKVLVEKLKSELEDFRNKNKSLIEANNNCLRKIICCMLTLRS